MANAGDSRAILFQPKLDDPLEMSYDFTPETDRQRIQLVAYQRPELLRHPVTKEKLYNRHILSRQVSLMSLKPDLPVPHPLPLLLGPL